MFNIIQPVGKCKVVCSIAQRTNKIRFCRENRMKKEAEKRKTKRKAVRRNKQRTALNMQKYET